MEHFSAVFPNKTRPINDMEEINFTEKEVYNKTRASVYKVLSTIYIPSDR